MASVETAYASNVYLFNTMWHPTCLVLDECFHVLLFREGTSQSSNAEKPTAGKYNVKNELVTYRPQTNKNNIMLCSLLVFTERSLWVTRVLTVVATMLLLTALLEFFVAQRHGSSDTRPDKHQSFCLAWLAVLDSINSLHGGRSTRALYEKDFKGNSLQLALAGSELMAKSDRSSQKSIQCRRKQLARASKEGTCSNWSGSLLTALTNK